jgi:hypothetical protein
MILGLGNGMETSFEQFNSYKQQEKQAGMNARKKSLK